MRTYKFRGKSTNTREWIYGFYWNPKERFSKESHIICDVNNRDIFEEVEPETVGQFTGLFDKNGKEIYESDIVKGGEHTYQVYWNPDVAGFVFCVNGRKDSWLFHKQIESKLEVIGTI